MKKILIITVLSLVVASSAFGATTLKIDLATAGLQGATLYGAKTGTAATTSPLIGKTSSGVGLGAFVNAQGTGYAIITQHKNGTKEFGSSFDSTSIFSTPVTIVGTAELAQPSGITTADFTALNWTSM